MEERNADSAGPFLGFAIHGGGSATGREAGGRGRLYAHVSGADGSKACNKCRSPK